MKKALVVAMVMVMVMGLGLAASAAAGLSGTWTGKISFDPTAIVFTDLVSFSSGLTVDYTVGGWTFESVSGFSNDGYDAQSFKASGTLGAFAFSSTMKFLPMAIANKTITHLYDGSLYGEVSLQTPPDTIPTIVTLTPPGKAWELLQPVKGSPEALFDDWTVTGSVSIAGVNLEGLFFMENWAGTKTTETIPVFEYEDTIAAGLLATVPVTSLLDAGNPTSGPYDYMPQTGSYKVVTGGKTKTGAGWRFKAAGSFGDVTLTSYTYFNLTEGFSATSTAMSLGRDGDFGIATNGSQAMAFTEEYFTMEGLSLGCITADAALRVTCAKGFEYAKIWFAGVPLIPNMNWTTDFTITFSLTDKSLSLIPVISNETTCWTPTLKLDWDAATSSLKGINLTGLKVSATVGAVTFTSNTVFGSGVPISTIDSGNTDNWYFLIPAVAYNASLVTAPVTIPTPIVADDGSGIYEIQKVSVATDYYKTFEDFTFAVEGDSCCGGAYSVSLETWFGKHYTATLGQWGYWYETNAHAITGGVTIGTTMDHGQGLYYDKAGVAGPAGAWYVGDDDMTTWIPYSGALPVTAADSAYMTLIGASTVPFTYPALTTPTVVEHFKSGSKTTETAATGAIFGWAKSKVDAKLGIGSNFTLNFGFAIDAYGWDNVNLGFEFTF